MCHFSRMLLCDFSILARKQITLKNLYGEGRWLLAIVRQFSDYVRGLVTTCVLA